MRKLIVAALAVVGVTAPLTHASPLTPAQVCGLPDAKPLWFDFSDGTVPFAAERFGKPGVIVATNGTALPSQLRDLGAQTVYWDNKLVSLVGTTTKPADPSTIPAAVDKDYGKAVASTGCSTPYIALNELNGPGSTTPWSTTNTQYRANVLALVQGLAARGAHPFLLIPAPAYTGGDARTWWLQISQVADIVREVYFKATSIYKLGPLLGSRRLRTAYRAGISNLTSMGIPVSKTGLVIGFQSTPGAGGREGLEPRSAWFGFVKLQTLAAKQVGSELGFSTIWSWGWATFSAAGADPDKSAAACVYLWTRARSLCNGPSAAGSGFDPSLTEGQIALAAGVQCKVDGRSVTANGIQRLTALTGDRDLAFTALFARAVEGENANVSPDRVKALERSVIALRFQGSRAAYLSALSRKRATAEVARGLLQDALRRADVSARLRPSAPSSSQLSLFYLTYPDLLVRLVRADTRPLWLGGRKQGYALAPPAPAEVLTAPLDVRTSVLGAAGPTRVTALEEPLPLGSLPYSLAKPAIRSALLAYAREDAYETWAMKAENGALNRVVCLRDDLPTIGAVDLSSYLPFLRLYA